MGPAGRRVFDGHAQGVISGGAGVDSIDGGAGVDTITCGAGTDTVNNATGDSVDPDCETVNP